MTRWGWSSVWPAGVLAEPLARHCISVYFLGTCAKRLAAAWDPALQHVTNHCLDEEQAFYLHLVVEKSTHVRCFVCLLTAAMEESFRA